MNRTISILGFVVGVIGLVIGIFSYLNSVKSKEISYNVYSPSYKIYDNEAIIGSSTLNILLEDSIKINQNIYLTTFSIWNSGDLPINTNDVRKEIEIEFIGIDKILDYKTIKEVEEGISEFDFKQINDTIFNLDWKFFDPNNGLKIQLVYFGDESITCEIDGNILQTEFKEFVPVQSQRRGYNIISPLVMIIMVLLIIATITYTIIKRGVPKVEFSFLFFILVINPIILLLVFAYYIYNFYFKVQDIPF